MALPTPARHEHHDPFWLNEEAVQALASGQRGTALILLERAAQLAPGDAVVAGNLAALRSGSRLGLEKGSQTNLKAAVIAPARATQATQAAQPELPIWPLPVPTPARGP